MEVVKILLGCDNIKLDIKDKFGRTALHAACQFNQVECVELFLTHTSCTKDIVRMEDNAGLTAEMWAIKEDNQLCARLVRKYLENDDYTADDRNNVGAKKGNQECAAIYDKCIDELVEFISGETEKKKMRKKKRNTVQPVQVQNSGIPTDIELLKVNENIKIKATDDSYTLETTDVDITDDCGKDQNRNNAKYTELIELNKVKMDLEGKIALKRLQFVANQQKAGDVIHTKSGQIKNITMNMKKSQNDKSTKVEEINTLDKQLKELESKMKNLKLKKTNLVKDSKTDDKKIQKYECEKQKLEEGIEKEVKMKEERENTISTEILYLERKLNDAEVSIRNLLKVTNNNTLQLPVDPNKDLLEFIENEIIEKERELECPVCLDIAASPILMCSEQHLICGSCRPKVSQCPECREWYTGKDKRHRYAEKTREELQRLREKKDQVINYSG